MPRPLGVSDHAAITKTTLLPPSSAAQQPDSPGGITILCVNYVTKPFDIRILVARLEAVLRRKKAEDAPRRANAGLPTTIGRRLHMMPGHEQ